MQDYKYIKNAFLRDETHQKYRLGESWESSDATKYSRETKEYDSHLARIPCAFSKKKK